MRGAENPRLITEGLARSAAACLPAIPPRVMMGAFINPDTDDS